MTVPDYRICRCGQVMAKVSVVMTDTEHIDDDGNVTPIPNPEGYPIVHWYCGAVMPDGSGSICNTTMIRPYGTPEQFDANDRMN